MGSPQIGGGAGTPTLGGGTGGRGSGMSMPRLTFFEWTEVRIGRIQAVTPKEGEAAPAPITDADHIKRALGYPEAAARGDTRPVLVYFHWPHDDAVHGKLSTAVCSRTLDDEHAARWSRMFRCVQVDMGETLAKYAEQVGSKGEPVFVALDDDLHVKAEIPVTRSGAKLRKALEAAFREFPDAVKALRKTEAEHRKLLQQAKRLEKRDAYADALELVDRIRFGDVRVTDTWEKSVGYGQLLAQKLERAR